MIPKKQKFFFSFILICDSLLGLDKELLIKKEVLGEIKLGMSKKNVLKVLNNRCETKRFIHGERRVNALRCLYGKGKFDLEFEDGLLYVIYIKDSIYHTQKGIRVGSKLSEVQSSYPLGKLFSGYLEGYYVFIREKSLSINFDFDISSIIHQDPKNYKSGFKVNPKDFDQIKNIRVKMIIIYK